MRRPDCRVRVALTPESRILARFPEKTSPDSRKSFRPFEQWIGRVQTAPRQDPEIFPLCGTSVPEHRAWMSFSQKEQTITMIEIAFLLTAGFTIGLYYSRGKSDPVASAIKDTTRLAVKAAGATGRAIRAVKDHRP